MGFPAGYTDVLLPKLLINTLSILGFLRKLVLTFLQLLGLAHFLESGTDADLSFSARPEPISAQHCSLSATLIREMLPAETFSPGPCGPDWPVPARDGPASCAVCLYEYEEGEEIRRMRNCRHMFHRSCVDRWIDHDRKTCPLCRKPFVPDELQEEFNDKLWAASGIPDFYSEYSHIANFL